MPNPEKQEDTLKQTSEDFRQGQGKEKRMVWRLAPSPGLFAAFSNVFLITWNMPPAGEAAVGWDK
jgi:hypothetical protein